jgi:hypothetical protein
VSSKSADLLHGARELLSRKDAATAGLWPRASALLARQALEAALDRYWTAQGTPLDQCSTRAKLICLKERHEDRNLATRVAHTWTALSRACHHHPYELAPTAQELEVWLGVVERFEESARDLRRSVEYGAE